MSESDLSDNALRVLKYIASCNDRDHNPPNKEIIEVLGLGETETHEALGELMECGFIGFIPRN